jgi:hypothetical protein
LAPASNWTALTGFSTSVSQIAGNGLDTLFAELGS